MLTSFPSHPKLRDPAGLDVPDQVARRHHRPLPIAANYVCHTSDKGFFFIILRSVHRHQGQRLARREPQGGDDQGVGQELQLLGAAAGAGPAHGVPGEGHLAHDLSVEKKKLLG